MANYTLTIVMTIPFLFTGQLSNTNAMNTINGTFFWGLVCLTIGACCYIFQTGFLTLFFEGFQRIAMPKSRSLEKVDRQWKEDAAFGYWKQRTMATGKVLFLGIGTGLTLVSIVGLWLFNNYL